MNLLKKAIIGLVVILVFLLAIGMFLPKLNKVERSTSIKAPAEIVFDQLNDLQKADKWSPWKDGDPTMKITFGQTTVGKGATTSWTAKKMGEGTQTIVESVPNSTVKLLLQFKGMGTADVTYALVPADEAITVTQTMVSDAGNNPFVRWVNLLTKGMLGGMFEKGLANLKSVSEIEVVEWNAKKLAEAEAAKAQAISDSTAAQAQADSIAAAIKNNRGHKSKKALHSK